MKRLRKVGEVSQGQSVGSEGRMSRSTMKLRKQDSSVCLFLLQSVMKEHRQTG